MDDIPNVPKKAETKTETTYGTAEGKTSIETTSTEKINALEKKISNLRKETNKIKEDLAESRRKIQTIDWITKAVFVAVSIAFMLVALDYFKYNEERYEKFIDKIDEINNVFSSKEDFIKINGKLDNFKECLKNGGWNECF